MIEGIFTISCRPYKGDDEEYLWFTLKESGGYIYSSQWIVERFS